MLHKQIAIAIFGVVLLVVIVVVFLYTFGPWTTKSTKHTEYVNFINTTFSPASVEIGKRTMVLESLGSQRAIVKSNEVIKNETSGGTLTLVTGITTVYILDSGFATNLTAVQVSLVNNTSFPAMFIDAGAATTATRLARETVGPGSTSQYMYVMAKGDTWQAVNPERNDVILGALTVGLVNTNAKSLVFDGSSLELK